MLRIKIKHNTKGPEPEFITVTEAIKKLSKGAFALWMFLNTIDGRVLSKRNSDIAKLYNCTKYTFQKYIKELGDNEFIYMNQVKRRSPLAEIVLWKRVRADFRCQLAISSSTSNKAQKITQRLNSRKF